MGCTTSKELEFTSALDRRESEDQVDEAAQAMFCDFHMSSRVDVTVYCSHLPQLDALSKSDPMVIVYQKSKEGRWYELGRSEVLVDEDNPHFQKHFPMTFMFEEEQIIKFDVYDVDQFDVDPLLLNLAKQDFIGSVETPLATIAASQSKMKTFRLINNSDRKRQWGTITIQVEELSNQNADVMLEFAVQNFNKSGSYFLRVSRLREAGQNDVCYRTELTKSNNRVLHWKCVKLNIQPLCNGDIYRPLIIELFQFGSNGTHSLVGSITTSLEKIQSVQSVQLKAPNLVELPYSLQFICCQVKPKFTFLDYIRGGCELNFMVAIDFTGSNGNPAQPGTLHYVDPTGNPNQYEKAITAVGNILEYYDSDRMFPTFGFGGIYNNNVSHCFPLNFNEQNPEVRGVDGILTSYKTAIRRCGLSGPTIFTPVISTAISYASQYQASGEQKYLILLIITDGCINDMDDTIAAIVTATDYPISILIVGVGNADFTNMNILDGDEIRLQSNGRVASRDIVQFVPMNQFVNQAQYVLTSELLAEIPKQLLDYMESRNITPKRYSTSPHRSGTMSSVSSYSITDQMKDRSNSTVGVPLASHYAQPPQPINIPSPPYTGDDNSNVNQQYPPGPLPPATNFYPV